MTKRGVPQTGAGKATQPRTLRARKRKFPGNEESAPAGDNETLQPGEQQGPSVCMLPSSGVKECSALLDKDVKASDSCTATAWREREADCITVQGERGAGRTTAQTEKGSSPSFQATGGSSGPDQGRGLGESSSLLSETKYAVHHVLESVTEKALTDNGRGAQRQSGSSHVETPSGVSCGETGQRDEGAEIQEYPSAVPSHTVPCPPGSLPPAGDGREVGREPGVTDGVTGRDGEKHKTTDGTGDHSSDRPLFEEERGSAPDAEPLRAGIRGRCEDGPTKKKVRKRMGMRGFGERERRTHCEGRLTSTNQKNGESEKGREREGKVGREHEEEPHSDCQKEVLGKNLEIATFNKAANGMELRTTEEVPDAVLGRTNQPGMFPSPSVLLAPTPLGGILEEEEPSQPGTEASYEIPEKPLTVGKTVAGETKTSHFVVHTEKTASRVGTSPCGPGEASPEQDGPGVSEEGPGASGGGRELTGLPFAELEGGAPQVWRDPWRCTGSPCAVQEEHFDLSGTGLQEALESPGRCGTSWARRGEALKVRGCSSRELEVSLDPKLPESGTVGAPCDRVVPAPFEGICLLGPTELTVSQTSRPRGESGPAEPFGVEYAGQGSSQGCASLVSVSELSEQHGDVEDSIMAPSLEPAPGISGARASPEECQDTPAHCVSVHLSQTRHTEPQRPSDRASLGVSTMSAGQHQDGGYRDLQNMVSAHDVQETGSQCGHPGPVCASVLPPVCEDRSLRWDTEVVRSFNTQLTTVRSPKPTDDPDPDPERRTSACSPSDSQLNSITLSEMGDGSTPGCADGREDASELVCGLIQELSFLNRTVMATHRELDNIRRGNKAPKAPVWRSYGSRRSEM